MVKRCFSVHLLETWFCTHEPCQSFALLAAIARVDHLTTWNAEGILHDDSRLVLAQTIETPLESGLAAALPASLGPM